MIPQPYNQSIVPPAPSDVVFRAPTPADIAFVAANMRAPDRRELMRWTAQQPAYELENSIFLSDVCYAGVFEDGTVGSIFGASRANIVESTATLWSLSSTAVDAHRKAFCRASREAVDMICRAMPDVAEFANFVDLEYTAAVRWIEWLGGTMAINSRIAGVRGGTFNSFYFPNPYYQGGI